MDIPEGIAAQLAMTQQAISLSMVKNAAKMDQKMADLLAQSAANIPGSSVRGTQVNFSA